MSSPLVLEVDTVKRMKSRHPTLVSPVEDGVRKISLSLLRPPSSLSSRTASSSSASVDIQTLSLRVPEHLDSVATNEFLGFTAERAKSLYASRIKAEQETSSKVDILDWATGSLARYDSVDDYTDDWNSAMVTAGINSSIREALMKEEHKNIRGIQNLSEWLIEIVTTNYYALESLNATMLASLELDPEASLRGGGDEEYNIPQMPGGHLALFKSVEITRCEGCIAEDGSVNLAQLESNGPTDFARRGGLYFTHQLWVASHYARLIDSCCPVANRRTVEIHVPLHHFDKIKTWTLNAEDEDFKRLLYHSRRGDLYPRDFSKKRAQFGIIAGPIGHTHNLSFGKMKSWSEITDKHILTEIEAEEQYGGDGKPKDTTKIGRQHVWITEDAIYQLQQDVFKKAYLRKPHQKFKLVPEPWNDKSAKSFLAN